MSLTRKNLVIAAVAATLVCSVLTFFVKTRPANLEFVTAHQELPNYQASYPDTALIDRVVKSYELALIIVQSPYMQKNLSALECIRRWAREHFAEQPDFLHPTVLPVKEANRDTVFGAMGFNLFSAVHAWLQEGVGHAIRSRIEGFHKTYAFETFRTAYFDFFGWDAEAALLLARYENDRAKTAVDCAIWAVAWGAGVVASIVYLFRSRRKSFFEALRNVTASAWAMIAAAYFFQAWDTERASSILSLIFASTVALYLYCPVAILTYEDIGKKLTRIRLTPNWIALAVWLTISLLAIQVLTWIRHSMPGSTDPITMFIGSITGNFLHDPSHGKRIVIEVTGGIWLAFTIWAWRQRVKTYEPELDVESRFDELDAVAPLVR